MTVWLIAYSARGCETALRAAEALTKRGADCRVFASEKHRVSERVGEAFRDGLKLKKGEA